MTTTITTMLTKWGRYCLYVVAAFLPGCDRGLVAPATKQDALEHFEGVIDDSGSTFDSAKSKLYVRASELLKNGNLDAAKSLYRSAIEEYPNDPSGYTSLGACFYFEYMYDDAKAQYLRALELDGQCYLAHYGLGCVAYEQNRHTDALEHLRKAVELDATASDCHRVLGMVYAATGNKSQAAHHYERAIALHGKDDSVKAFLRDLKI